MLPDRPETPEDLLRRYLELVGFRGDPEMATTAERVTKFLADYVPREPPPVSTCAWEATDPLVIREIPFWSLCAHHLLPFHGTVAVAMRPGGTLLGLGSIPALVHHFAQQPQLQERLAAQLADHLLVVARPASVVVAIRARHMCVEMRGATGHPEIEVRASRGAPDPEITALIG